MVAMVVLQAGMAVWPQQQPQLQQEVPRCPLETAGCRHCPSLTAGATKQLPQLLLVVAASWLFWVHQLQAAATCPLLQQVPQKGSWIPVCCRISRRVVWCLPNSSSSCSRSLTGSLAQQSQQLLVLVAVVLLSTVLRHLLVVIRTEWVTSQQQRQACLHQCLLVRQLVLRLMDSCSYWCLDHQHQLALLRRRLVVVVVVTAARVSWGSMMAPEAPLLWVWVVWAVQPLRSCPQLHLQTVVLQRWRGQWRLTQLNLLSRMDLLACWRCCSRPSVKQLVSVAFLYSSSLYDMDPWPSGFRRGASMCGVEK